MKGRMGTTFHLGKHFGLRELGDSVGAAKDKLVYQLSVDEGNRRRERDNS